MKVLGFLRALQAFYDRACRAGHTTAMMHGALATPTCVVVANDSDHVRTIVRDFELDPRGKGSTTCVISLEQLTNNFMHASKQPLLVDHFTLCNVLGEAEAAIVHLQAEVARLKAKISAAQRILS